MNIILIQETVAAKPINAMLHNILTFLYFLPHQIGLWMVKILQQLFPRILFADSLVDPLGFLIVLTLFVALARAAQKIAWIIVCVGWILLLVRILMIIFKLG
jgi:hypothetical protein